VIEPDRVQRVAAYNVCVDADDRLLLCRLSAVTEAPGSWTLPGGGIDFGEHPEAGAVRELREETGLIGHVAELLAVDSLHRAARAGEDGHEYHSIRIIYRTVIDGGTLTHETNESTDRAAWCTRTELETLPLVSTSLLGVRLAYGDRA
jgi:8-oxo-dGTP diphosphatase